MSAATPPADKTPWIVRRLSFLDAPKFRGAMVFVLGALTLVLFGVDFVHERHEDAEMAERWGFYVIVGAVTFAVIALAGWPLARLLGRPHDYYGDGDDDGR